jgi:nitroimidazol reductase NimA-like FMN-containing flavoprotein (pyridoxamine 5'-phosphate oxidase superfamily)
MAVQDLTEAECISILARTRLGRLGCAHQNQPYVVPIYFAYEQPYIYAFTIPGQKVDWMRYNPLVCLEVDEVVDSEHWRSVVIFGRYEELQDLPDWKDPSLHVLDLLNKRAGWWHPGCASATYRDPAQPLIPIFYRIRIDRISGRQATPGSVTPERASTPSSVRNSQGWLRRIIHALIGGFDRTISVAKAPAPYSRVRDFAR